MGRQLVSFAAIGTVSTAVSLALFLWTCGALGAVGANAFALTATALANTWANRRWTFGIRGREGAARHQVQGLLVFVLTLGMTSGGLALLGLVAPGAPTWVETGVVAVTTVAATAVKYLAMRWWVFAPGGRTVTAPGQNEGPEGSTGLNQSAEKLPSSSVNRTTT